MKQILLYTLFSIVLFSVTVCGRAAEAEPLPINTPSETGLELTAVNEDAGSMSISIRGNVVQIRVVNGQNQSLKVYDLVGRLKYESHIDSNDKTLHLTLNKGIYLINFGKVTRRISVAG